MSHGAGPRHPGGERGGANNAARAAGGFPSCHQAREASGQQLPKAWRAAGRPAGQRFRGHGGAPARGDRNSACGAQGPRCGADVRASARKEVLACSEGPNTYGGPFGRRRWPARAAAAFAAARARPRRRLRSVRDFGRDNDTTCQPPGSRCRRRAPRRAHATRGAGGAGQRQAPRGRRAPRAAACGVHTGLAPSRAGDQLVGFASAARGARVRAVFATRRPRAGGAVCQ